MAPHNDTVVDSCHMNGPNDCFFPDNRNVVLTNYGRTAFEKILQINELHGATVAFPAFLSNDIFEHLIDEYDIEPVFVDVNPRSYHIDVERVKYQIEEVDAVVLNHTFGVPAEVREWQIIADRPDVTLIEDCARGFGAFVQRQPIGSFGDHAIYSLKKVSPAVRGGALATTVDPSDIDLESPVYDLKNAYPLLPDRIEFWVTRLYRNIVKNGESEDGGDGNRLHPLSPEIREMDEINALVFLFHLYRGFKQQLIQNAEFASRIRQPLAELGVEFQVTHGTCPFHFIGMVVPDGRDEIADRLRKIGVAPRTLWNPPLVASFAEENRYSEFPNTMTLVENGLQLPLVEMTEKDVSRTVEVIRQITEEHTTRHTKRRPYPG